MHSKKISLLAVTLVVGLVMVAAVYALVPTDVMEGVPTLVQDVDYQKIDIDLIRNIDAEMLDLMDGDRDGKVSMEEFTQTGGADILFEIADVDNNGFLSLEDLSSFSSSVGPEAAGGDLFSQTCQWFEIDGSWSYLCRVCCWIKISNTWYCVCWYEQKMGQVRS